MKKTALIPARSGSKRIPDKNIKELRGLRLIEHSIITALACDCFDNIIVNSDSYEWIAEKYADDNVKYLNRPDELCGDDIGDNPVIKHAIKEMYLTGLIVYLRPTTPLRAIYHIETAIKTLEKDISATGLRSVHEMSESAYKCYQMQSAYLDPVLFHAAEGGNSLRAEGIDFTNLPNQQCPPTYKPNGYVDICRSEKVMSGQLWGNKIIGYITPWTIEIDTPRDWEYAQFLANKHIDPLYSHGKERLNNGD